MSAQVSVQNSTQESGPFTSPLSPEAVTPNSMFDDVDTFANNNATTESNSEGTLPQNLIAKFDKVKINPKAPVNDEQNLVSEPQVQKAETQMQPPEAEIDAKSDVHLTYENVDVAEPLFIGSLTVPAEVDSSRIPALMEITAKCISSKDYTKAVEVLNQCLSILWDSTGNPPPFVESGFENSLLSNVKTLFSMQDTYKAFIELVPHLTARARKSAIEGFFGGARDRSAALNASPVDIGKRARGRKIENTDKFDDSFVTEMQYSFGKIRVKIENDHSAGVGSAFLISEWQVLCSAHSIDPHLAAIGAYSVSFGKADVADAKHVYNVRCAAFPGDSHFPSDLITCGPGGDFCVLSLIYKDDKQKSPGRLAKKKYIEFLTREMREEIMESELTLVGYSSGTGLTISQGAAFSMSLTKAVDRQYNIVTGTPISKLEKPYGVVESMSYEPGATPSASISGTTYALVVSPGSVTPITRKSGFIYKNPGEFSADMLPWMGTDHMLCTLKSNHGSSGGAYFTSTGYFIAMHRGVLSKDISSCLAAAGEKELHLAVFPNEENTTDFWDSYLTEENGKRAKKTSKEAPVRQMIGLKVIPNPPPPGQFFVSLNGTDTSTHQILSKWVEMLPTGVTSGTGVVAEEDVSDGAADSENTAGITNILLPPTENTTYKSYAYKITYLCTEEWREKNLEIIMRRDEISSVQVDNLELSAGEKENIKFYKGTAEGLILPPSEFISELRSVNGEWQDVSNRKFQWGSFSPGVGENKDFKPFVDKVDERKYKHTTTDQLSNVRYYHITVNDKQMTKDYKRGGSVHFAINNLNSCIRVVAVGTHVENRKNDHNKRAQYQFHKNNITRAFRKLFPDGASSSDGNIFFIDLKK